MEKYFEICHTQIPLDKIIEYRVIEREYIYRPAYYVTTDSWRRKKYNFSHMVPYAAIYSEADYKSAVKAWKAITAGQAVAQDVANGLIGEIGDRLNIKTWKYSKFTCRNQAGRVFSTYLQDVPASVETSDGKRSEVYPHDELYKELGEPIAPSIDFIPALIILTKDELYTFYGCGIQVDEELEYQRLKTELNEYRLEKENATSRKALERPKPVLPKIQAPKIQTPVININLPKFVKKQEVVQSEKTADTEVNEAEQIEYDAMDLNHDGVVDEKDLEIMRQRMEQN